MGGFNSGRPRRKAYLEQLLYLSIAHFRGSLGKVGGSGSCKWANGSEIGVAIREGGVTLSYAVNGEKVRQEVAVTETPCQYGKARPWFACPKCGGRVGKLYLLGKHFICRSCTGLKYRSQSEGLEGRLLRRHDRYRRRLDPKAAGWGPGLIPPRPRGMHQTTYKRLAGQAMEAEKAREALFMPQLERLLERLAGVERPRWPDFWD